MKKHLKKLALAATLIIFLSGADLALNAQNVNLAYSFPAGKEVRYSMTTSMAQIMDFQGQSMQVDMKSAFGCTVKPVNSKGGNLVLEVTVDTIGQYTDSPMGGSGGAVYGVKGKSCQVVIEPGGKVSDLSGAAQLVYNTEGGQSNLSEAMSDFFPILPGRAVKEGDTWSFNETIATESPSSRTTKTESAESRLVGFETVNGTECAKIATTHTGTITMDISAQGMDIRIEGPFTGTSECLFAIKEGYFLKLDKHTAVQGNFELSAMGMNMPMTMETWTVTVAE